MEKNVKRKFDEIIGDGGVSERLTKKAKESLDQNEEAESSTNEGSNVFSNNSSNSSSSSQSSNDQTALEVEERNLNDFSSEAEIDKASNLTRDHTQTEESLGLGHIFNDEQVHSQAFAYINRVIDYNNLTNRASAASDQFEDSRLEEHYLNRLEDPAQLLTDGHNLLEQCSNNPEAADWVTTVISAIGNII